MLKKVLKFILNKLRYIVFGFVIFILTLLLSPIILMFKWSGMWVLAVANKEGCSLKEAKRLLDEGVKYEYARHGVWRLDEEGKRIPRSVIEFSGKYDNKKFNIRSLSSDSGFTYRDNRDFHVYYDRYYK